MKLSAHKTPKKVLIAGAPLTIVFELNLWKNWKVSFSSLAQNFDFEMSLNEFWFWFEWFDSLNKESLN